MLNETFILTNDLSGVRALEKTVLPARVRIAFRLDMQADDVRTLVEYCYESVLANEFVLCLRNIKAGTDINELAVLIAHPKHYRCYNRSLVLIEHESMLAVISRFLETHGYVNSRVAVVDDRVVKNGGYCFVRELKSEEVISSDSEFEKSYRTRIEERYDVDEIIVMKPTGISALEKAGDHFESIINNLSKANPKLVKLTELAACYHERNRQSEALLEIYKNDVFVLNELLRIRSENKEMEKVLSFYHKEYEVLPLWYKRLGHVIKVITGKRSYKSLFSDNDK